MKRLMQGILLATLIVGGVVAARVRVAAPRVSWEYYWMHENSQDLRDMNPLGAQGWELVTYAPPSKNPFVGRPNEGLWIFKRQALP